MLRGQRKQKKKEAFEKREILEEEMHLMEQQTLLLKQKQHLCESSQNIEFIENIDTAKQNPEEQDIGKSSIKETIFENPTEEDIKCMTRDPKTIIEKKKD